MQTSLLARLLAVARTVTPLAPVSAATLALDRLAPGQSIRAEVTARLDEGAFRVAAGDQPIKLSLPPGVKVGDVITLRLVAREPRLQFEIDLEPAQVQPRLSGTGRLIGRILNGPTDARPPANPVTATPVADAARLRAPLARAIEASGLFYESHQARWIDGEFPLELLREEPQARFGRAQATPGRKPPTLQGDAPEPLDDRAPDAAPARPERSGPGGRQPGTPQAAPGPSVALITADGGEPIDITPAYLPSAPAARATPAEDGAQSAVLREILPIVRQQLEAIETRQIVWQGELWPGQSMRWEIGEDEPEAREPQAPRQWHTRLALRLPALGGIDARLTLGPDGVRVAVKAEDRDSAEALRAHAAQLSQALAAAGLDVAALEVRHGG